MLNAVRSTAEVRWVFGKEIQGRLPGVGHMCLGLQRFSERQGLREEGHFRQSMSCG